MSKYSWPPQRSTPTSHDGSKKPPLISSPPTAAIGITRWNAPCRCAPDSRASTLGVGNAAAAAVTCGDGDECVLTEGHRDRPCCRVAALRENPRLPVLSVSRKVSASSADRSRYPAAAADCSGDFVLLSITSSFVAVALPLPCWCGWRCYRDLLDQSVCAMSSTSRVPVSWRFFTCRAMCCRVVVLLPLRRSATI